MLGIKKLVKKILPEGVQNKIRRSKSYKKAIDASYSRDLAVSFKRMDLCAAQFAHLLHLSEGVSVKDKVCVEVGGGWVLSHALVLHLLGAREVIVTDIQRLAHPANLYKCIHNATDSIVRDILSPFEKHEKLRSRLNNLLKIEKFTFKTLEDLGIRYIAPINMAERPLGMKFDFAYSLVVLEHIPLEQVRKLLKNLTEDLTDGGHMIHVIHLEDHKSIENGPFNFLAEPEETFDVETIGIRGNRMRSSQWREVFSSVKNLDYKFIFEWRRMDKEIPQNIDPSIKYIDKDDLTVSHIGVLATKKQNK